MRILRTPPLAIAMIYLVAFGAVGYLATVFQDLVTLLQVAFVIMAFPLLFFVLWSFALAQTAARALAQRFDRDPPTTSVLPFVLAGASSAVLPLIMSLSNVGWNSTNLIVQTVLVISIVSQFVCIWASATALVRFEERHSEVPASRVFGTFFLILYFPIGIWLMWSRIRNLLADTANSAAPPRDS